jgi:hypothetical protein
VIPAIKNSRLFISLLPHQLDARRTPAVTADCIGSIRLVCMNAERMGRALGRGVRAAGKTLVEVVEAAAAPADASSTSSGTGPDPVLRQPALRAVAGSATPAASGQRQAPGRQKSSRTGSLRTGSLLRGGKRFGQTLWSPAARAGGVLWYEVTGSFFALFALAAGVEVWRHRLDLLAATRSGASPAAGKVWFAVAMLQLS